MKNWTEAVVEEISFVSTENGGKPTIEEDHVYTSPNGNPYCAS